MKPRTALLVMFPFLLLVTAFVLVATRGAGAAPVADGLFWDEEIARFVRQRVAATYVDSLDETRASQAFYDAMDAYVRSLDDYCDFIPPEEHRRWREATRGEYAGLGVKVREHDEGLLLIGVLPGGPAARVGLAPGDVIVSAGGRSLGGVDLATIEATSLLKGETGSPVELGVLPLSGQEEGAPRPALRSVVVRREVIRPPSVYSRRVGENGEFGVIRLTEFVETTEEDFNAALDAMLKDGLKGLVLDLRDNGGGVLPTAVRVAGRFLSKGVIVRSEGRGATSSRVYTAQPEGTVPDTLPLVVLVNGTSASASEVVAGALQDHRRALLVGERTYGKFLIQQITELPNRDAAVKLTISRYYLPSGRSYQRHGRNERSRGADDDALEPAGLLPDVVLALDEAARERLLDQWQNEEAGPWGEPTPNPEVPADAIDPQLARGLELLEGQIVLQRIRRTAPSTGRPQ